MKSRASHRRRRNPAAKSSGLATTSGTGTPYARDLILSGLIGGLVSMKVSSWKGVLLTATVTELFIGLVGTSLPGCYPPDRSRNWTHKLVGIGVFFGGWMIGRALQEKEVFEF